jgi:hypothetical protein
MDFPSYVPNAVRVSMAARLEGDSYEPSGYLAALAKAEDDLQRIQAQRAGWHHDEAISNELRIEHALATAHRDHWAAEVACCQRLVHDARMQTAYALLVSLPNVTDADLSGFIYAAWAARMNYTKHRDQREAADELAREVAKTAGALADLLRKAEGFVGPYLPTEFFSIQSLLEKTEHDNSDRNFSMWPGMRRFVLGEPPRDSGTVTAPDPEQSEPAAPITPTETARNALRYAWGTAPSMARIITTMQREAMTYAAAESGHIGAALATRKRNPKYEYLRAFGALLRDVHRMEVSADTMKAMATTATVVLNTPELDVTYDDVRKALATIAR